MECNPSDQGQIRRLDQCCTMYNRIDLILAVVWWQDRPDQRVYQEVVGDSLDLCERSVRDMLRDDYHCE